MGDAATRLMRDWLARQLDAARSSWLDEQLAACRSLADATAFELAWGLIPRRLGKTALALTEADFIAAGQALNGWNPRHWNVTDAARVLLLSGSALGALPFAKRFRSLCQTADVAELITLYRGLPLYPEATSLLDQVGEGLRSNMRDVFEAIVHHNPYPRTHFDEHRWNHMVVKALFVGSPLAPIQGLDQRANADLARILCDFAEERRAAARVVPFEVWRCVGPFATGKAFDLIAAALGSAVPLERHAAALGIASSPDARAPHLLQQHSALHAEIDAKRLTWATLS